jgi:hypothetical protein
MRSGSNDAAVAAAVDPGDVGLEFAGDDGGLASRISPTDKTGFAAEKGGAALSLAGVVAQLLNGAVHDGPVSGGASGPVRTGPLSPAAFATLKTSSYAACFAAVVLLRDPVLLFACLVTLVTVFFGEWWFLYVASAVPLMYHISTTFNFLNGGMVPHVVAAASALNNMLNMVFVGVALIAAWSSFKSLMVLDFAAAWAYSGRFSYIMSTVAAKIIVENTASEAIAEFVGRVFRAAKGVVGIVVSALGFLPGILMDAFAVASN